MGNIKQNFQYTIVALQGQLCVVQRNGSGQIKKKFVQICDRRGSGNKKKNNKNEIKRTAVDEKQQ